MRKPWCTHCNQFVETKKVENVEANKAEKRIITILYAFFLILTLIMFIINILAGLIFLVATVLNPCSFIYPCRPGKYTKNVCSICGKKVIWKKMDESPEKFQNTELPWE